jgi:hypothetical protein
MDQDEVPDHENELTDVNCQGALNACEGHHARSVVAVSHAHLCPNQRLLWSNRLLTSVLSQRMNPFEVPGHENELTDVTQQQCACESHASSCCRCETCASLPSLKTAAVFPTHARHMRQRSGLIDACELKADISVVDSHFSSVWQDFCWGRWRAAEKKERV